MKRRRTNVPTKWNRDAGQNGGAAGGGGGGRGGGNSSDDAERISDRRRFGTDARAGPFLGQSQSAGGVYYF